MRGERERTDGSERSSANLRACSLLGVLLTVVSQEAPKLLLEEEEKEDSLTLSPPSSPPCSSSMSTATAAWRGAGSFFLRPDCLSSQRPMLLLFILAILESRQREIERGKGCQMSCHDSYLPRPPTEKGDLF